MRRTRPLSNLLETLAVPSPAFGARVGGQPPPQPTFNNAGASAPTTKPPSVLTTARLSNKKEVSATLVRPLGKRSNHFIIIIAQKNI